MEERKLNIKTLKITSDDALKTIEKQFRPHYQANDNVEEKLPWAIGTSYSEIVKNVIPDKEGAWKNPLYFVRTWHKQNHGIKEICDKANVYLRNLKEDSDSEFDILSLQSAIADNSVVLNILIRVYGNSAFSFKGFFDFIGENIENIDTGDQDLTLSGELIVSDDIKAAIPTREMQKEYKETPEYKKQEEVYKNCDFEHPFLNSLNTYLPKALPNPLDQIDPIYDMLSSEKSIKTVSKYEDFDKAFKGAMKHVYGIERMNYINVIKGIASESGFMTAAVEQFIRTEYIKTGNLAEEDLQLLMRKLHKSLFQLYILQDMIDDPKISDINITAPDSIRVRVKGRTYLSNVNFIDEGDYIRFVDTLYIRNNLKKYIASQTFTDQRDENYILRITLSSAYANMNFWPYVHIRKVARKKLLGDDLVKEGFMTEKVKQYLLDCGKTSRGVVFAGAPGSGKTVALNWFLEEAYEHSADVLVIQENDELFAYRKGVKFQHVVSNTTEDGEAIDLEALGRLALVAGANVFIIGEAKGGEICSAITLSNSGCRTAITIHSPSSTETLDKMADLAMRGYAQTHEQAMRMLKSFQTIVYMENFGISEISEITGYNEEDKCIEYRCIYRRDLDPEAPVRE